MQKWRVRVLPHDSGSDKRGWSLRGQRLYPVLSEDGTLLAWVARSPQVETKEQAWNGLPPDQRATEKKPAKHRFPVDFHRGLELFGQYASRLNEPGDREAVARHDISGVEGFNDVLGLDAISVQRSRSCRTILLTNRSPKSNAGQGSSRDGAQEALCSSHSGDSMCASAGAKRFTAGS